MQEVNINNNEIYIRDENNLEEEEEVENQYEDNNSENS
jgi:hypothetical protein